jgi:hypothetical protein
MAQEEGMKRLVCLALLIALTGCSSLAPGAERIKLTRDGQDVAGCKVVGPISFNKPLQCRPWCGSYSKEMKNTAFAEGADVVFITSSQDASQGVAYNCSGVDPRQPVPVAPVKP